MAHVCGIEFSDFGFNAAMLDPSTDGLVTVNEAAGEWPAFAAWNGSELVFGREAEKHWRLFPRAVSHVFWEHLSLAPSDLEGPPRTPAYSELAYAFLHSFWENLCKSSGKPEKVVLAMPGQLLGDSNADNPAIGLILAIARDLGIPLAGLCGLSTSSLNDPASMGSITGGRILYMDLHLHSAAMSLLTTDSDGRLNRRHYMRLPRLGYVPLIQGLHKSMGNRFLRATAFDVTAQRELDQLFYEQTREQLLDASRGTDIRYSIQTSSRVYQAAFPRETLRRDLAPHEQGWADAAVKFLSDSSFQPKDVTVVVSSRVGMLPGLDDALTTRGFGRVVHLQHGAAARGAARFAADLEVAEDITTVPVVSKVEVSARAETSSGGGIEVVHVAAAKPSPGLVASHLVVDGSAYSLHALPEVLQGDGNADAPAVPALARLGPVPVRLIRQDGEWHIETPDSGALLMAPGDRVKIRSGAEEVELLIVAESRPGTA
ncbi:MAG: hypothetical protein QNL51_02570 [Opitutaceae bacterium]|tara:strand:- start:12168 stop:13628 length:1461 start_codon:yes stop_codon:yes gene_type:complete